jgi:hypothetical protein
MQAATPAPYNPASALPLLVMIGMIFVAVKDAPQKLRAFLIIIAWIVVGIATGAGIGFALSNPPLAGDLAGILTLVLGIGAAWDRMRKNKKAKATL